MLVYTVPAAESARASGAVFSHTDIFVFVQLLLTGNFLILFHTIPAEFIQRSRPGGPHTSSVRCSFTQLAVSHLSISQLTQFRTPISHPVFAN